MGYLSFLKIGPALLKFVPGRKAKDLRNWLTVYGYWNQGGLENVETAFYVVAKEYLPGVAEIEIAGEDLLSHTEESSNDVFSRIKKVVTSVVGGHLGGTASAPEKNTLAAPKETPPIGFYHPDLEERKMNWPTTADEYEKWYQSRAEVLSDDSYSKYTPPIHVPLDAPTVALLLYRKHVITKQPYLADLVRALEEAGVRPVPIFINGVEAHTVVRDLLTTSHEIAQRKMGNMEIDSLSQGAICVDAVVSTVRVPDLLCPLWALTTSS